MQMWLLVGHKPLPVLVETSALSSVSIPVSPAVEPEEPSPMSVVPVAVVGGGAVVENVANVVGPDPVVVFAPVLPGAASPPEQARATHPQIQTQRKRSIGHQDTSFAPAACVALASCGGRPERRSSPAARLGRASVR